VYLFVTLKDKEQFRISSLFPSFIFFSLSSIRNLLLQFQKIHLLSWNIHQWM